MYLYQIQLYWQNPVSATLHRREVKSNMDTKFSVAIHLLILISQSPRPMNSEAMAESVGTNASYIRKITGLLKKSKIIVGGRGKNGYKLTQKPEKFSMLNIYRAVEGEDRVHILDVHQNSNDKCIVGRYIKPVLGSMFGAMESAFCKLLNKKTLADCIKEMRNRINNIGINNNIGQPAPAEALC